MKKIMEAFFIVAYLSLVLGCGENKSDVKPQSTGSDFKIPDKKMCELLTKEMMSSITGISFNEEMVTLHQIDPGSGKYVSQCGYYIDGGNMGVLVRRFGDISFPKNKEALIGAQATGDAELDAMMNKAVETSKAVNNLGDAAFFFDLGGIINLIVVFQDHYQIQISSFGKGFSFDDNTLQLSKKVAEEVIKIFKGS